CGWSSDSAKSNDECAWGSWLLAEYGQKCPFIELSRRVSPKHLGYAIKKRGFKPEEVTAYGEILNRNMPDGYVPTDVLAEVVASCPKYVSQWLDTERRNMIWRHQGFYESLCEVLLEKQPKQGKQLFGEMHRNNRHRTVDSGTKIPLLFFSAFKAADSAEVCSIRRILRGKTLTDNDLFEIAFLAQKHNRYEWLEKTITVYLNSDFALDIAKGLFLLGFMGTPSAGEQLDTWIAEKKPSWLHDCARRAKIIHERNQWAHHWFERFVNHEEKLQAWAAFHLFLRCVDRRFWLWGEKVISSPDVRYERLEHYRACRGSIVQKVKKNEEKSPFELKKCLVGWKVQESQLWPWLGAYLQEDSEPEDLAEAQRLRAKTDVAPINDDLLNAAKNAGRP
ncbi:hypothetical protein VU12_14760, partial [Desulfobulbus sp. US4]|nr:hypothetical protein [Desulfobulbus sp. US4]